MSGTGQIHVANSAGQTFATMVAEKNQGAFTIRSASGATVARLGEGTGGGLLQLADLAGYAMVEAGIHPSGVGLVPTHPIGSPALGMVGMPGTFLLGRPGNTFGVRLYGGHTSDANRLRFAIMAVGFLAFLRAFSLPIGTSIRLKVQRAISAAVR